MKHSLALCMIVKNEEDTLANVLSSVEGIFDEIVVVDTGSNDATVDVARRFTQKIFYFEWCDDFAKARNFAFEQSSCEYVMWLDADDVLLEEDATKLKKIKADLDGNIREIAARYNVAFDENGNAVMTYYRERIFLARAGFKWSGRVHETIPLERDCVYADFAVTHRKIHPTEKGRNLRIFEKMKADGEGFDARSSFYYARELYYNQRLDDAVRELKSFLTRSDGFLENKIDACSILGTCLRQKGQSPLSALFKSFEYDVPRAEICCDLGSYFQACGNREQAVYWYREALSKTPNTESGAFVLRDCYDFVPLLQLCVLYFALNDIQKAVECNNAAAKLKPNNKAVLYNKKFFNDYLSGGKNVL